jgi:hypothetical protein
MKEPEIQEEGEDEGTPMLPQHLCLQEGQTPNILEFITECS